MNKYLLPTILAALFFCQTIKAQVHVDLGVGVSNIICNYPKTGARMSAFIGGGYELSLGSRLSLDPMLRLCKAGKEMYGITTVNLPILLNYKFNFFDIGAGIYGSYGINSEMNEERIYDAPPLDWNGHWDPYWRDAFGYFNRFDFGIAARARFKIKKVFAGIECNYGVLDIGRKYGSEDDSYGHTLNFNIVLGYRF